MRVEGRGKGAWNLAKGGNVNSEYDNPPTLWVIMRVDGPNAPVP